MRRVLFIPLLAAIAITPAVAVATQTRAHIPNCAKVSRTKMATLAQTGHLRLEKKIGNLCEFTGQGLHPHHYKTMFGIQITPYKKSIWNTAKSDAEKSAAKNGDTFGEVSKRMFFVTGEYTDKGLQPCKKSLGTPGKGQSKYGPVCNPEPPASHIGVYGNGIDRRNHLHLMVSSVVTGQKGDVHLSHMITLVKEVISGKIH